MNKKILVISEIFPPLHGGSGRWFWELYSRLPRNQCTIAAGKSAGAEKFDSTHDLDVIRLPLSSAAWGVRSITGLRFYWKNFINLRSLIKSNNTKQIHCGRCLPEGVFGYLMNKLYKIPYLCYVHGEDIEIASTSRELSYIVRKVLNNASTLISNSKNTQAILINHWKVKPDKTVVLNPGMDATRFVPADYDPDTRKKLGWDDRPVLLTVGRLQERKGQDMLIKALPEIRNHYPDILYAIIGDGEEKKTLTALVEHYQLHDHIQFLSEIDDQEMVECYQQCTLFVLPNRTVGKDIEGFGMVLVEAQACGKPVLAGDSGGTAETMVVGETGFIADCTSPQTLSKEIIDILNNIDHFPEIGVKAREHVVKNFDWEVHSRKASLIFENIPE